MVRTSAHQLQPHTISSASVIKLVLHRSMQVFSIQFAHVTQFSPRFRTVCHVCTVDSRQ